MGVLTVLVKEIKELYKFRWVSISLVSSTLKMRYKRSVLGIFWTMLGPVLNYAMIGFFFSLLSRSTMDRYFIFMFTGSVLFNLFSSVTLGSSNVFITNEHYIKKIYLPKSIFIINLVVMETINFFFGFVALLIIGLITGKLNLSWAILTVPFCVMITVLFITGISCLIGIISVYFRDFLQFTPLMIQAMFFGSPILYEMKDIPEKLQFFLKLNPMYYFIECFRDAVYYERLPSLSSFGIATAIGVITFGVGFVILKKLDNEIIFQL